MENVKFEYRGPFHCKKCGREIPEDRDCPRCEGGPMWPVVLGLVALGMIAGVLVMRHVRHLAQPSGNEIVVGIDDLAVGVATQPYFPCIQPDGSTKLRDEACPPWPEKQQPAKVGAWPVIGVEPFQVGCLWKRSDNEVWRWNGTVWEPIGSEAEKSKYPILGEIRSNGSFDGTVDVWNGKRWIRSDATKLSDAFFEYHPQHYGNVHFLKGSVDNIYVGDDLVWSAKEKKEMPYSTPTPEPDDLLALFVNNGSSADFPICVGASHFDVGYVCRSLDGKHWEVYTKDGWKTYEVRP